METLKFNTIQELTDWLNEGTFSISDLNITIPVVTSGYAHVEGDVLGNTTTATITTSAGGPVTTDTVLINTNESVVREIAIKSLSTQPNIQQIALTEDVDGNVWYVDEYEAIEDACSTSKVVYKGSTMLMNVCESNGESKVSLIVEVDGEIARMSFKLKNSCDNTSEYDMILAI